MLLALLHQAAMFGAEDKYALGKREKYIKFQSETPKKRNDT